MGFIPDMPKAECPGCNKKKATFARGRALPNGDIVYPKKGFEPPPDIEGYKRAPGNPWHFQPLWPDCDHRRRLLQMKKCGAYSVTMVCACADCPLVQKLIGIKDCENCPHRSAS